MGGQNKKRKKKEIMGYCHGI